MIPEFTVSEITRIFQNLVHETFTYIKIKGEIGEINTPNSGNIYLTLKDKDDILHAVCWKNTATNIDFKEGVEIMCTGYLTTYKSKYQLIIIAAFEVGHGKFQLEFEKIKNKLQAEGLFDQKNKKTLPILPKILGVITSRTGAVIHDILNRIQHRFPIHVLIHSSSVQGTHSLKEIIRAIRDFNTMESKSPDLIIIARGGGSAEDLEVFNQELIVREVVKSKIPILSAIGHENNLTLVDYAADVCAPTPTAAIEIALPLKSHLFENLRNKSKYITHLMQIILNKYKNKILTYQNKLINPTNKIELLHFKINAHKNSVRSSLQQIITNNTKLLDQLFVRICHYDQKKILETGYTIIYDKTGKSIPTSTFLQESDEVTIKWKDGHRKAIIIN